jgi:hypothetical protein
VNSSAVPSLEESAKRKAQNRKAKLQMANVKDQNTNLLQRKAQ